MYRWPEHRRRWYGDFGSQSSQVDTRMRTLCDNIKVGGVTIYTVQIDTDGAGQSAVLPYCASGTSNFFMLTQPSQIATAFSQSAPKSRSCAWRDDRSVVGRNSSRKSPAIWPGF